MADAQESIGSAVARKIARRFRSAAPPPQLRAHSLTIVNTRGIQHATGHLAALLSGNQSVGHDAIRAINIASDRGWIATPTEIISVTDRHNMLLPAAVDPDGKYHKFAEMEVQSLGPGSPLQYNCCVSVNQSTSGLSTIRRLDNHQVPLFRTLLTHLTDAQRISDRNAFGNNAIVAVPYLPDLDLPANLDFTTPAIGFQRYGTEAVLHASGIDLEVALKYLTAPSRAAFSAFCAHPLAHQRLLLLFNMQLVPPHTFRANMDTGIVAASPDSDLLVHILTDLLIHHFEYLHLTSELPDFDNITLSGALYPQLVDASAVPPTVACILVAPLSFADAAPVCISAQLLADTFGITQDDINASSQLPPCINHVRFGAFTLSGHTITAAHAHQ